MSNLAIKIEGLYKEYRLGVIGHGTLYRDLQSWWAKIQKKEDPNSIIGFTHNHKQIVSNNRVLSLQDINFSVQEGEALGIIGANGAGKSTLLKVLSRVTAPTRGEVKIRGRIASLLEVGTGFHPELTGKENIYLNAAINGMNKKETTAKLDEIVAFAGIERFIDTPVKRYSSGMFVRLAFSVAAHLDPDILLVDEVLAVGDAGFQQKAIGKMQNVSREEGRTVLFVSHNMEVIKKLCSRAVLLDSGQVKKDGAIDEVVDSYLSIASEKTKEHMGERVWDDLQKAPGNDVVRLVAIRTKDKFHNVCPEFDVCDSFFVEFEYIVLEEGFQLSAAVEFISAVDDQVLMRSFDDYVRGPWGQQTPTQKGRHVCRFLFPGNLLGEGEVYISLRIFIPPFETNQSEQLKELGVLSFSIVDSLNPQGARGSYPYHLGHVIRPLLTWDRDYYSVEELNPSGV